jgi:hypothetical protein
MKTIYAERRQGYGNERKTEKKTRKACEVGRYLAFT